jgi:hypothetical protein
MSHAKKLSRRIFEEVWNNKNTAAIDELIAGQLRSSRSPEPEVFGWSRRIQTTGRALS